MSRKKISTTVYLDPVQVEQLRALSEDRAVPQSVLIRLAIENLLELSANSLDRKLRNMPRCLASWSGAVPR